MFQIPAAFSKRQISELHQEVGRKEITQTNSSKAVSSQTIPSEDIPT